MWRSNLKSFKRNVESRVKEDDERLIPHSVLQGVAIENCVTLPSKQDCREVRKILCKNFGQKHTTVRVFIDKVTKGPQIRAWEAEKLPQLARDIKCCSLTLSKCVTRRT